MSGNVKAVWVETTVKYFYPDTVEDVRHAEYNDITKYDAKTFTSLEVRDPSSEWKLAVEAHLKRVREFTSGTIKNHPLTISKVRTEVCAKVDNGRKFAWVISVKDKECQPLTEGNVIPEEATVAALFRGAQATVAILGPVGSDAATATSESPTAEPAKGGIQATSGTSTAPEDEEVAPKKKPAGWPRNIPWEIEP